MSRIRSRFLAFMAMIGVALPLAADLSGVTTTPINLSAKTYAATVGPDGNVWILTDKGTLAKLTPSGSYTEFPLKFGSSVFSVVPGIDGNLWIPGPNGHVERVTTNGVVTDFAVAPNFYFPYPAILGADGAIWFFGNQNPAPGGSNTWKLGRIDIYGQFTTYDLGISDLSGSGDFLRSLVSGGDGNLWFIDETKNQVVKFSLVTRSITGTYAIPSSGGADQMTLGWDGNVWFTRTKSIDRVTPDGTVTEFTIPSGGAPAAILMSGDNTLLFTEPSSGVLGQLVLSSVTPNGTATIVESSSGLVTNVNTLLNVPPGFGATATSDAFREAPSAELCTGQRLAANTFGELEAVSYSYPPPCRADYADMFISLRNEFVNVGGNPNGIKNVSVVFGDSSTVRSQSTAARAAASGTILATAIVNLSAPAGVTVGVVTTNDPSAQVSVNGLKVTITSSLPSVAATIPLSTPAGVPGPIAGTAVEASTASDPDPRQHVAPLFFDSATLTGRPALPPQPPNIVTKPIGRGK